MKKNDNLFFCKALKNKALYLFVLFLMNFHYAQVVSIGTETINSGIPTYPNYGYSYSQNIYLSSEINQSGNIYAITFDCVNPIVLDSSNEWVVYMTNTSKSDFTSKTDWVTVGLTQVFSGTVNAVDGKLKIVLDTPFNYNGTDNLLISVDENKSGYDGFGDYFYGSNVNTSRSIYYANDGTNPDPMSPPEANYNQSYIANVQLDFTQVTCFTPTNISVNNIAETTADVTWTAPATVPANGYEYYYTTDTTTPDDATVATGTTSVNSVSLTGLSSATQYHLWVRSVCGATDKSDWSPMTNFQTTCGTYTIDYEDSFETVGSISESCWTYHLENCPSSELDVWYYEQQTQRGIRLKQRGNTEGAIYFISPKMTDLDNNRTIEAKIRSEYNNFSCTFEIGIMSDATDINTFEPLTNVQNPITAEWMDISADTQDYTGSNEGHIVFKYTLPNSSYNNIIIDEIVYKETSLATEEIDINGKDVVVYPNPFKEVVKINNIDGVATISVVDMAGKLVGEFEPTKDLNLSNLDAGMYIIRLVYKDGSVKTVKTIKK